MTVGPPVAEIAGFRLLRRAARRPALPRLAARPVRLALALAAFACASAVATAAVDDTKIIFPGASAPAGAPAAGSGGSVGSVTLVLGLALAAAGGWFVWRGRRAAPVGRAAQLVISETRGLGNRQYLVVASYENKKFLLGVCPGRIDLLAPLHEPSTPGQPRA